MKLIIINKETKQRIKDEDLLMALASMEKYCDFEDIGVQGDGTPVIFNKCGGFGYLDSNVYEVQFVCVVN